MTTNTADIIIRTKDEAEQVLEAMKALLQQYEQVTFADFLELSGLPSTFGDTKYIWTNLDNVEVKEAKGGFIVDMPRLKAPAEWCRESNIQMMDPDAWRNEGKSWTEPITYSEFERLLGGPNTYAKASQR